MLACPSCKEGECKFELLSELVKGEWSVLQMFEVAT